MSQTLIGPMSAPASTAGEPHPGDHSIWHLPDRLSARTMLSRGQTVTLAAACAGIAAALGLWLATGLGPSPQTWAMLAVGAATVIYIAVISFRLLLVIAAQEAPVMRFSQAELKAAAAAGMPVYTILVPLYREERVLPTLVAKLARLDYPADRLQILLLIEEDDDLTRAALDALTLDSRFETVLIPPSQPRTKPKACNVGLLHARGEFVVIFDAEDRPEPDQLRKAVAAFRGLPSWVVCVQAELQYWNPWTNWLTRCFAAEYALHFSLALRGLDRFHVPIPLGGTSNHFRTDALRELGAWDPYNVTEDADLGMRIARRGWAVRMMLSVTEEEANSQVGNWIRQRSRWIKGYYQTWLVHMRSPWRLLRELGLRQFLGFQLTLGFSTLTGLLNPIFWSLTVLYLVTGPAHIRALFPGPILYLGVLSMLIGNLLMMQSMMAGCMDRGLYAAVRTMLTIPLYWVLMSVAAYKAFIQLLRPGRRHYWELTQHGLVAEHGVASPPSDPEVRDWRSLNVVGSAAARQHSGPAGGGPVSAPAAAAQAEEPAPAPVPPPTPEPESPDSPELTHAPEQPQPVLPLESASDPPPPEPAPAPELAQVSKPTQAVELMQAAGPALVPASPPAPESTLGLEPTQASKPPEGPEPTHTAEQPEPLPASKSVGEDQVWTVLYENGMSLIAASELMARNLAEAEGQCGGRVAVRRLNGVGTDLCGVEKAAGPAGRARGEDPLRPRGDKPSVPGPSRAAGNAESVPEPEPNRTAGWFVRPKPRRGGS